MTDIYLYAGEASPSDVVLADPTAPRGYWPGVSVLTEDQVMQANGIVNNWGVVLYPMGQLIPAGGAVFRPVGSPVVRRIDL